MRVKGIVIEDFSNYKLPSMFIISTKCDFKCCKEQGLKLDICQNSPIALKPIIDIDDATIFDFYENNDITKAVVIGGLEPFLQFEEVYELILYFRCQKEECDFVIYTGYYPSEIEDQINILSCFSNVIVKYGRYIPALPSRYDDILGVTLSSNNQYAERISNNYVGE